jgi:hypothetical protein
MPASVSTLDSAHSCEEQRGTVDESAFCGNCGGGGDARPGRVYIVDAQADPVDRIVARARRGFRVTRHQHGQLDTLQ